VRGFGADLRCAGLVKIAEVHSRSGVQRKSV
jgi:hypothetical protein